MEKPEKRIAGALEVISACGGTDGGHHKQWVLDQVVRALTGDDYEEWKRGHEWWDEGIPS